MRTPVRRALGLCLDAMSSRAASFWVIGAWIALALVWLVPFQLTGQPEATLRGIGNDWLPFRAAHRALVATSAVCGLVRLGKDLGRLRLKRSAGRPLPLEPMDSCVGDLEAARAALGRMGFAVSRLEDRVTGVQRRWSLLSGSLFHLGVPLLAAGLVAHAATAGSIQFRLIEGQSSDVPLAGLAAGEGDWEALPSSAASLTLETLEPSFFQDVLLFERLAATVVEEGTGRTRGFSLSSPLWLDPFTLMSVQDFGYAPRVQLLSPSGEVVEEVIAAAALFPPGSLDRVSLPGHGYTVSMVVYPDHARMGGRDVSASYNLRNPKVLMGVERTFPSGIVEGRRLVSVGETLGVSGMDVRVAEMRRFGVLRVWRSYGWPLLALAGVMMTAGLGCRTLLPARHVVVWRHGEGLGVLARVDGRPGRAAGLPLAREVGRRISDGASGEGAGT